MFHSPLERARQGGPQGQGEKMNGCNEWRYRSNYSICVSCIITRNKVFMHLQYIDSSQAITGKSKVCSSGTVHPWEEEAAANIWKEANCCLRHCKNRPFCGYPKWSMHTKPY